MDEKFCKHGDDYVFSPPDSNELYCGLCLLERVSQLEKDILRDMFSEDDETER